MTSRPCWHLKNEPKCPANHQTGECPLWFAGSYVMHMHERGTVFKCEFWRVPFDQSSVRTGAES